MIRSYDVLRRSFIDALHTGALAAGWLSLLLVLVHLAAPHVRAADPQFVGILAELAKDDVARQLGLSDETRTKLNELIDRREEEVVQLVLKIMDLPADEQEKRLAPFRRESEEQGLALLDERQRAIILGLYPVQGEGRTLEKVGTYHSLSKERVRQIKNTAAAELRSAFTRP